MNFAFIFIHLFIVSNNFEQSATGSFPCESESAVLHEGSVFAIEGSNIQVRSLQGTVKQTLSFTESDGEPIGLDVCGNFLVTATITGMIKLWDLSRR